MMIVVAAAAAWTDLAMRWPELAIYSVILLVGPVAGAVHFGRDEPDRAVSGGVIGGVASHVAAGLLFVVIAASMSPGGLPSGWLVFVALATLGYVFVGIFAGLVVGLFVSVTLEVRRWMRRRHEAAT